MASTLDLYSPASSAASSTDSANLPKSRIKCTKNLIAVGGQRFDSASDALVAYLQQYDTIGTQDKMDQSSAGNRPESQNGLSQRHLQPVTNSQKLTALLSENDRIKAGQVTIKTVSSSNGHPWTSEDYHSLTTSQLKQDSGKDMASSKLVSGTNGIKGSHNAEDVEKLLTSQVSPKLQEEVTDALREVKLRRLLKQAALKSQSQTKTGLQQEVEAALLRSAQLLEKVTKEDLPSTKPANSDISSIPTEVLLNDTTSSLDISEIGEKKSGHIYSYRKSRPQKSSHDHSISQTLCAPVSYPLQRRSRDRRHRTSVDSLLPPLHHLHFHGKRSSSSSSTSVSNQSDPTDVIHRLRSRSVSPGLRNQMTSSATPDWVEQLDQSVRKSVPSWVGDINASEMSDSLWTSEDLLENKNNRRPNKVPSWVGEIGSSDIMTDPHFHDTRPIIPIISTPARPDINGDNASDITADSRPGLNFSDLAASALHTPSSNKHVTFSDSTQKSGPYLGKQLPRHSSPLVGADGVSHSDAHPRPSRVLDSEFNGEAFLRNNILPQTAKLKKSLDNFVTSSENLRRKSVSSNSSEAGSEARSSNLDTLALLTGRATTRTDISGPSPIPKDSNMVSKNYSPSPTISAINPDGQALSPSSNGHDQDSSDGLDGDRSWERVTNSFKPPVPVECDEPGSRHHLRNGLSPNKSFEGTLSGGKQPGSMETLKNMLFKLQAEETSTQGENSRNEDTSEEQQNSSSDIIPGLQNYDFQQEPGGHSLEKALFHLNRLKTLVKTTATSGKNDSSAKTAQTNEGDAQMEMP